MRHIIVAGCGHGGLVSAARLAGQGYHVTVIEKKKESELGYDWHDRFTFSLLAEETGMPETSFPEDIWEYRGDCTFISPAKRKQIVIKYNDENRQKIMWRKPLIQMLVDRAKKNGAEFCFGTEIITPVIEGCKVIGVQTKDGVIQADLVIDAAGVFSPLRTALPKYFNIETQPKDGDVFYAYRAYFNKTMDIMPEAPFEVYLCHEGEPGLSWFYTAEDYVDVLIGRTQQPDAKKIGEELRIFREEHPWMGSRILHGGSFGCIPVRRPLTLMVAHGYAAVGDSAFMTTPMNGMGIDLSIEAGKLLADTVIHAGDKPYSANVLWEYNRDFHMLYGGDTAKNEGLKNALLQLASDGVDFLFEQDVIQASDLSGAGNNTTLPALLGKFTRGMKRPPYFTAILKGLAGGRKAANLYKDAPLSYDLHKILSWSRKIEQCDIRA